MSAHHPLRASVAFGLLLCSAATVASAQAITNGGFENPSDTNVFAGTGWTAEGAVGGREPWAAHTGDRGAYFPSFVADGSGTVYQTLSATTGTYTFALWIRKELGATDQGSSVRIEWFDADTNSIQAASSSDLTAVPSDEAWHQVHVTGTCGDVNLAMVRVLVSCDWGTPVSGQVSSFMLDDAEFYSGSYTGTAAALLERSFEKGYGNGWRGSGWYTHPELDGGSHGGQREPWANFASATGVAFYGFTSDSNNYSATVAQNLYIGTGTYTFSIWIRREENFLLDSVALNIRRFDATLTNVLESASTPLALPADAQWHEYWLTGTFDSNDAVETRVSLDANWTFNTTDIFGRAMMADETRFYAGSFRPHLVTDWAYHNATNFDPTVEQVPGTNNFGAFLQIDYAATTTTFYVLANNPSVANRSDESGAVWIRIAWFEPVTFALHEEYYDMTFVANLNLDTGNPFHGTPASGSKTLDIWKYDWKQPLDTNGVPYTNEITVFYAPYIRSLLNGTETDVRWLVAHDGVVTNGWVTNPQVLGTNFANIDYHYQNIGLPSADADGDGMLDEWELAKFGNTTNGAAGDVDLDEHDNLDEYIADTDPTNNLSFFGPITNAAANASVLGLMVDPTSTGRVYDAYYSTNLPDGTWVAYGLGVTGSGSALLLYVTNDAPTRSYRSGVRLP